MITLTKNELDEMIEAFDKKHQSDSHIYVVMRWGYTEEEMLAKPFQVELLLYDDNSFERLWETDWWEGEDCIEVWCILTDDDIIRRVGASRF